MATYSLSPFLLQLVAEQSANSVSSEAADSTHEQECGICLESLQSRGGAVELPCNCRSSYCGECWNSALASSFVATGHIRCPTCRCELDIDYDTVTGKPIFKLGVWRNPSERKIMLDQLHSQLNVDQIKLMKQYGASSCHTKRLSHRYDQRHHFGFSAAPQRCCKCSKMCLNRGDEKSGEVFCEGCYKHHFPLGAMPVAPSCPCGGELSCMSVEQRKQQLLSETDTRSWSSLMECHDGEPKEESSLGCELCQKELNDGYVWTCSRGNCTVLHMHGHDICEDCFRHHASSGASQARREVWSALESRL